MRGLAEALWRLSARTPGEPLFAHGFPGRTPSRLGQRMGLYRPLGPVQVHQVQAVGAPPSWWSCRVHPMSWDAGLSGSPAWIDRQWHRLSPQQGHTQPIACRTAAYMGWRYRDHPAQPYRLWRVSSQGVRTLGWLVTRDQPDPAVIDSLLPASWSHPAHWGSVLAALAHASGQPNWASWRAAGGPFVHVSGEESLIVPGEFRYADILGHTPSAWALQPSAPTFQPGDTDVY